MYQLRIKAQVEVIEMVSGISSDVSSGQNKQIRNRQASAETACSQTSAGNRGMANKRPRSQALSSFHPGATKLLKGVFVLI